MFIDEFLKVNNFIKETPHKEWHLSGLTPNFNTITFSQTLKSGYQNMINLDTRFLGYLTNITMKRNRLHFYKNYAGAFEVNRHLESIKFARDYGLTLIGKKIEAMRELKTSTI